MMNCDWGKCPILRVIEKIGLDALIEGIREEKRKSANLLTDEACLILYVIRNYTEVNE